MQHKKPPGRFTQTLFSAPADSFSRVIAVGAPRLSLMGFLALIIVGWLLLALPFSHATVQNTPLLTDLFEATSAVCVTGLSMVDVSSYYSLFGQWVLLLLIQLGGLGYMTMYSLMLLAVRRRMSLREQLALQQVLDLPGPRGVASFILKILRFTLILEGLGAFFLCWVWVPEYGLGKGLYLSIFHSVSAFNNAGFSLFPDSLISYSSHPVVLPVIAWLIIMGSMGYPVISEIWSHWHERRLSWRGLSLHTRVSLLATAALLVLGTLAYLVLEFNQPGTLRERSFPDKLLSAFFMAVTPRTAGFNALDLPLLTQASLFITLSLMLVGANPGGTGGGIKTTTMVVVLRDVYSTLRGQRDSVLFKRRISAATRNKAWSTILLAILWINAATLCLTVTEQDALLPMLFEVVSAFATVGLSLGYTPELSLLGQLIIIGTMYVGRVGVLTLGMAIWQQRKTSAMRYPEENLMVG